MHTFYDLQDALGMTVPHIRKLAGFIYPGVKLLTDEQVQHLIDIRAEMNAGLSWKEAEAKYGTNSKSRIRLLPKSKNEQSSIQPIQHTIINIYIH